MQAGSGKEAAAVEGAVHLPQELIECIHEWMKAWDARSRSDAIRQLIELGLDRSAVKTRQPKKPRQHRST
jgi:metal-responsive CopG/Arc/MetJ family transcriptional regulator